MTGIEGSAAQAAVQPSSKRKDHAAGDQAGKASKRPKLRPDGGQGGVAATDALLRKKQTQLVAAAPVGHSITVAELQTDEVAKLAHRTWGVGAVRTAGKTMSEAAAADGVAEPGAAASVFEPKVVTRLYRWQLGSKRGREAQRAAQILELSQYLERYLWPHFDPESATPEHVMSIIIMTNEKFREGLPAWDNFLEAAPAVASGAADANGENGASENVDNADVTAPSGAHKSVQAQDEKWKGFVQRTLGFLQDGELMLGPRRMRTSEVSQYLRFLIHLFQSLETAHVRDSMLRLVSLPLWWGLSARRREVELHNNEAYAKKWRALERKDRKAASKAAKAGSKHLPWNEKPEATFLPMLLDYFLQILPTVVTDAPVAVKPELDSAAMVEDAAPVSKGDAGQGAGADDVDDEDEDDDDESDEDVVLDGDEAVAAETAMDTDAVNGGTAQDEAEAAEAGLKRGALHVCERFLEFFVDLLSQLPTRRFLHALLMDRTVLLKARRSRVYHHESGLLFAQLLDQLDFYMHFPIDNYSGEALTELDVERAADESVLQLQRLLYRYWPASSPLRDVALSNCAAVRGRVLLATSVASLSLDDLVRLVVTQLRVMSSDASEASDSSFLTEALISRYEARPSQKAAIAAMPLYPTEGMLWDENQIPSIHTGGDACLALPKLNLQFLTFWDYLLRNFNLYRLEATYEIREDVAEVLKRLQPEHDVAAQPLCARFRGWSRMAIPVTTFSIVEVARPRVGELKPAAVTAELVIDLSAVRRDDVRREWDELKEHDVIFLVTLAPPPAHELARLRAAGEVGIAVSAGLRHLRGAEVLEIRDADGQLFNDFSGRVKYEDQHRPRVGTRRTLLLALDTAQYQHDVDAAGGNKGAVMPEELYASFNVVMRRKAKENNFKAVLESIRDLMREEASIPSWMHDLFLGYGDPADAQYKSLEGTLRHLDCRDTFLSAAHIRSAFPEHTVIFRTHESDAAGEPLADDDPRLAPPSDINPRQRFRITLPAFSPETPASPLPADVPEPADSGTIVAVPYTPIKSTPYPQLEPGQNLVRFNREQVQVIVGGLQPGLTMCVGPPGTGKTDTAVQLLNLLYHNMPDQRTLVVAHSNQALNDVFSKTIERDVPARYLLRLGMGQEDLDTDVDFSRTGRVNAMLQRRIELLDQVSKLAEQLGVPTDAGYTCETAGYFYTLHVLGRWERFLAGVARARQEAAAAAAGGSADGASTSDEAAASARGRAQSAVKRLFPFSEFFADAPQPLFAGQSAEADMEAARVCWRHLQTMFKELEECRAFELLKGQADRVNYLVTKHAKIVAMTCTHAALKRREFLKLGFRYDTLVMEEAAQVLEIETLIPMLLQAPQDGHNRLKRIILIGDHHQLPPVVKNPAFAKYAHFDQSLFTRFVRLAVPYTELSAQGRARPSIAKLYNWRYRALGDLEHVRAGRFVTPNAGFALDYQFVDVKALRGPGESAPSPYFYQNVDEAETLVRVYMYMRLIGYPASKISMLTTYNGQKALLEDVVSRHCTHNPLFGPPARIATVDKYQGQQNDFILLSLVRTQRAGHLRDVRRLVVAMSRARYGLYVFGCRALFEQCYELAPTFKQLLARPTDLALVPSERWGSEGTLQARPVAAKGAAAAAAPPLPEGTLLVQSLPQLEGIVQGVADRVAAEVQAAAAEAAPAAAAAQAAPAGNAAAVAAAPAGGEDDAPPGTEDVAAQQPTDVPAAAQAAEQSSEDGARPDAAKGPRPPSGPPPPLHPQQQQMMMRPPMGMAPMLMHPHQYSGFAGGPPGGVMMGPPQAMGMPMMMPPPMMMPGALPPQAFMLPTFVVQAPVAPPPEEAVTGVPLKRKRPRGKRKGAPKDKGEKAATVAEESEPAQGATENTNEEAAAAEANEPAAS